MRRSHGLGVVPGHELIEPGLFVPVHDGLECGGQPCLWVDVVQFAGFDQRRDHCPVLCPGIVTCKEGVLAVEGNGTDAAFDGVAVDLDATVVEEQDQSAQVFGDVFEGLAYRGFGRDSGAIGGEPDFKFKEDVSCRTRILA